MASSMVISLGTCGPVGDAETGSRSSPRRGRFRSAERGSGAGAGGPTGGFRGGSASMTTGSPRRGRGPVAMPSILGMAGCSGLSAFLCPRPPPETSGWISGGSMTLNAASPCAAWSSAIILRSNAFRLTCGAPPPCILHTFEPLAANFPQGLPFAASVRGTAAWVVESFFVCHCAKHVVSLMVWWPQNSCLTGLFAYTRPVSVWMASEQARGSQEDRRYYAHWPRCSH